RPVRALPRRPGSRVRRARLLHEPGLRAHPAAAPPCARRDDRGRVGRRGGQRPVPVEERGAGRGHQRLGRDVGPARRARWRVLRRRRRRGGRRARRGRAGRCAPVCRGPRGGGAPVGGVRRAHRDRRSRLSGL
ncbi:MAG: Short-chain dehydrogenase/reductase SDR, partial [uncultured Friedmanniella sp.]